MPNVDLKEIRVDRFFGLLEKAAGHRLCFAMCNLHGDLEWISDASMSQRVEWSIKQVGGNYGGLYSQGLVPAARHSFLADGGVFFYHVLGTKLTGVIGYLVALMDTPDAVNNPGLIVQTKNAIKEIGVCVEAEYLLTEELNEMAAELANRYEELNLVYCFEEQIKKYDPKHGVLVLRQLIRDCVDYLGVDAVMLALPTEGIKEIYIAPDSEHDLENREELLRSIQTEFLAKVFSARSSIVVNEPDFSGGRFYHNEHHLKLGVAPVVDFRANVRGILAIAVRPQKPNISNSDRKLLEVLAKQVSVLIESSYDMLTGLLNREGFDSRSQSVLTAPDGVEHDHSLLVINVDQFKVVNDTCGQMAGDELLKQIAGLICLRIRGSDAAARLGSDEFAVFLHNCPLETSMAVAEKLSQAIKRHRFAWDGKIFSVTASIGVVAIDESSATVTQHLGRAHSACLVAKQIGLGKVYQYQAHDAALAAHTGQMNWVPRLQSAIDKNGFKLYAQPIASIDGSDPVPRLEILLRLKDEQGGLLAPDSFLPAAERYQLMTRIDRWVIRNSMQALAGALKGREDTPLSCSINLSGQSLTEDGLLEYILAEHQATTIPAGSISFEITETAAVASFAAARRMICTLREYGFRFSLDDFGSGLSSFSYLSNLPVDYLKIDGALVREVARNPVQATMVESIAKIGHAMDIKTIAEFVENDAILAKLGTMHIDYAQGYGIGKPVPLDELLNILVPVPSAISAGSG